MNDYNNVILNHNAFEELMSRLSLPDGNALERRDNGLADFDESVEITRHGDEVILNVEEDYLKSLAKSCVLIVRDEKLAKELQRYDEWHDSLPYRTEQTERKIYQRGEISVNSKRMPMTETDLFAA